MLYGVFVTRQRNWLFDYQDIELIFVEYPEDGGNILLRNVTKHHGHATRNQSWTARAGGTCITLHPEYVSPVTCAIGE